MTVAEIDARQDELYRVSDWATEQGIYLLLEYCYGRCQELDALRSSEASA